MYYPKKDTEIDFEAEPEAKSSLNTSLKELELQLYYMASISTNVAQVSVGNIESIKKIGAMMKAFYEWMRPGLERYYKPIADELDMAIEMSGNLYGKLGPQLSSGKMNPNDKNTILFIESIEFIHRKLHEARNRLGYAPTIVRGMSFSQKLDNALLS